MYSDKHPGWEELENTVRIAQKRIAKAAKGLENETEISLSTTIDVTPSQAKKIVTFIQKVMKEKKK